MYKKAIITEPERVYVLNFFLDDVNGKVCAKKWLKVKKNAVTTIHLVCFCLIATALVMSTVTDSKDRKWITKSRVKVIL